MFSFQNSFYGLYVIYIHFSDIKLKFFKNPISYPKFGQISSNLSNTGIHVYHVIMLSSAWSLVFDKAILTTINKIVYSPIQQKQNAFYVCVCSTKNIKVNKVTLGRRDSP